MSFPLIICLHTVSVSPPRQVALTLEDASIPGGIFQWRFRFKLHIHAIKKMVVVQNIIYTIDIYIYIYIFLQVNVQGFMGTALRTCVTLPPDEKRCTMQLQGANRL